MNIFGFLNSTSYTFEGKKDEEEVYLFLHRHWFTLASKTAMITLGACLPFLFLVIFGSLVIKYHLISVFAFLWAAYYAFLWFMLFYFLTMYTLDVWIVTDSRIINSIQHGFFRRRVSELNIERIQDVSVAVDGAIATFFNFGMVEVQTAGAEHRFLFEQIANPQAVKDEVMELIAMHKKKNFHHGVDNTDLKHMDQRFNAGTKDSESSTDNYVEDFTGDANDDIGDNTGDDTGEDEPVE